MAASATFAFESQCLVPIFRFSRSHKRATPEVQENRVTWLTSKMATAAGPISAPPSAVNKQLAVVHAWSSIRIGLIQGWPRMVSTEGQCSLPSPSQLCTVGRPPMVKMDRERGRARDTRCGESDELRLRS